LTLLDNASVDAAQALIREARERQLRRRRRAAFLLVLAVIVGGVAYGTATRGGSGHPPLSPPPHSQPPPPPKAARPIVNPDALRGQGTLAFVSRGALWLLGGGAGSLHELLPAADQPQRPAFSADGKWLEISGVTHGADRIWLARADGSDLRLLPPETLSDGWSPRGHVLAVEVSPGDQPLSTIEVLTPTRAGHMITRVDGSCGTVWSPDGDALAVAACDQPTGRMTIRTYPLAGGPPTTWFSANNSRGRLDGMNELRLQPVGWWRHRGIGFWVYGDGMVHNTDQAPLDLLRSPGAIPTRLASDPSNQNATQISASTTGRLALVQQTGSSGFGRLIWQDKRVETCPPASARCTPAPAAPHTVTLDPAWSSNGHTLAYIQAPRVATDGFPSRTVHRWYAAHQLEIYNATTGSRRTVPGSQGASAPQWSRDGKTLLYVDDNRIWILPAHAKAPSRVAASLYSQNVWPTYYGQVDWIGQFAWSRDVAAASPAGI
jgi:hypothetical protein